MASFLLAQVKAGQQFVERMIKAVCAALGALAVCHLALAVELPPKGVCAHRGASSSYPENTVPAFQAAAKLGAQMIEFDVWLTRDGQAVIMHDPSVNRTTDGHGKIAELTLAEIRALDAGGKKGSQFKGLKVPTLEEALAVMPTNVWLNVHLKEGAAAARIAAAALKQTHRLHQAVLACTAPAAAAARSVAPEIKICCMDRQTGKMPDYVQTAIDQKADFIQLLAPPPADLKDLVARLKEHGIRVNYYGTETPDGLRKLYEAGVDFALVNDVSAGLKVAGEFGVKPNVPAP
jgi:glycerophosphoryl diester phosphodiesterase